MSSALRATALLAGSSIVSVLVGLVSSKVWAVLLGPSGFGLMGLLQSLVGLAVLIAGMGIGAGLVRAGAKGLAHGNHAEFTALRQSAWMLFWLLGGLAALVLVTAREVFSTWLLGGPEHADSIALMGLALIFTVAAGIETNVLNAHHRVATLAKVGLLSSVLGAAASLPLLWLLSEQGIAPALIAVAAMSWAVAFYFVRKEVPSVRVAPTRQEVFQAAGSLLRFGAPYTASMLVGAGAQLVVPFLVLHSLGTEGVGFYKAAVTISVGYLAFLHTAMAQDYYPRVSAVSNQSEELGHLINQQQRLLMLVATPLILALLGLTSHFVPIIYSADFLPAGEVLEWQLIGDLLRFSSWTMSFVILARCRSSTFFFTELIGGLATVVINWLAMRWFGLIGLGVGFVATYAVYYIVVWSVVRREVRLIWTVENKLLLSGCLLLALATRLPSAFGYDQLHTPVALSLATLAAIGSIYMLRHELVAIKFLVAGRVVPASRDSELEASRP
jgi:enterobacterial common antigen flippase